MNVLNRPIYRFEKLTEVMTDNLEAYRAYTLALEQTSSLRQKKRMPMTAWA